MHDDGEKSEGEGAGPDLAGDASLEGTLERVVYSNPDSKWTVARVRVSDRPDLATIVGNLIDVPPGAALRLRGQWVKDARYGEQFKVRTYVTLTPSTLEGIERYLGSGLVPGVGLTLAKRIVEQFGTSTLEMIEKHPDRLAEVSGIGAARAGRIHEAWNEQRAVADVMLFLQGCGVSPAFAARIYKRYGQRSIEVVREDPYRLALEIWGIGFKSADAIAARLGVARDSPRRAQAGIMHLLQVLSEDGHVFYPRAELVEHGAQTLEIDLVILREAVTELAAAGLVIVDELPGHGSCVYTVPLHEAETHTATRLATLASTKAAPLGVDIDQALANFERDAEIQLAPGQRAAVRAAVTEKLAVITGGPGVGKTTVVRAVVEILTRAGRLVSLAAPTGRAAKRMSEATGRNALTLHRLLEWSPRNASFLRGPHDPLDADAVIVDEASMIDISLADHLVAALKPRARLILVGDIDQLPAVGPGSVLGDVIASKRAAVSRLTEIFRQAAQSQIVTNAHRVNGGEFPSESGGDFFFIARDTPEETLATLEEVVCQRIPKRFHLDPMNEVQVLCPMHRGLVGASNLNEVLQRALNPAGREIVRSRRTFRVGDKVMQVRNNYDRDVFNGDLGRIVGIAPGADGSEEVSVEFDLRRIIYDARDLDELAHAYAISVHKAQGSEYPAVVIPLLTQHFMMLQRSLLYTGITRGKQLVVLIGQPRAVDIAVRTQPQKVRMSALGQRLADAVSSAGTGPLA